MSTMSFRVYTINLVILLSHVLRSASMICEPVRIPMCRAMPYNMTRMPNLLHHSTQKNAILAFEPFEQLVNTSCSDVLLFFLCSMYVPICTINFQPDVIPPCKSVCLRARSGCEPIMNKYNVSWPETLECSDLPEYDRGVCISPEAIVTVFPQRPKIKSTEKHTDKGCACRTTPTLNRQRYLSGNFHYAIKARIRTTGFRSGNIITRVKVEKIIKTSTVSVSAKQEIDISNSATCTCPPLLRGKRYLLLGYEDQRNRMLIFDNTCIATTWKKSYPRRIQAWELRLKRRALRRKRTRKKTRRHPDKDITQRLNPFEIKRRRRKNGKREREN